MMVKCEKSMVITLVLNEQEARYLRALTQNYMGMDLSEESKEDKEIREAYFNKINRHLGEGIR